MRQIMFFLVITLGVAMSWAGAQEEANTLGCQFDGEQTCVYPAVKQSGAEAIATINKVLHISTGTIRVLDGDNDVCNVKWSSVADNEWSTKANPLYGELTFINPKTGRPMGEFWIAKALQYTYQKTDIAFGFGENDFVMDHTFRVNGASSNKYEFVIHEHGDMALGISFKVNGEQKTVEQFCETEF